MILEYPDTQWNGEPVCSLLQRMDDYGWMDWFHDSAFVMDDYGNAIPVIWGEPFPGFFIE